MKFSSAVAGICIGVFLLGCQGPAWSPFRAVLAHDPVDAKSVPGKASAPANLSSMGALASITQSETGRITRTVMPTPWPFVSVQDFGAVGDGITDDTAAINATLQSSQTVLIPDTGSPYKVTSSLVVRNGQRILMLGELHVAPTGDKTGFLLNRVHDVVIDGLGQGRITGSGTYVAYYDAIKVVDSRDVTVRKAILGNAFANGVSVTQSAGTGVLANITVEDCTMHNLKTAGVNILGWDENNYYVNVNVSRNRIYAVGQTGNTQEFAYAVTVGYARNVSINGNVVKGIYGTKFALQVFKTFDASILNNDIDTSNCAIGVYPFATETLVANNFITNSHFTHIEVKNSDRTLVQNNYMYHHASLVDFAPGNHGQWAFAASGSEIVINGNHMYDFEKNGLVIGNDAVHHGNVLLYDNYFFQGHLGTGTFSALQILDNTGNIEVFGNFFTDVPVAIKVSSAIPNSKFVINIVGNEFVNLDWAVAYFEGEARNIKLRSNVMRFNESPRAGNDIIINDNADYIYIADDNVWTHKVIGTSPRTHAP